MRIHFQRNLPRERTWAHDPLGDINTTISFGGVTINAGAEAKAFTTDVCCDVDVGDGYRHTQSEIAAEDLPLGHI
jgi:hypothetical protein